MNIRQAKAEAYELVTDMVTTFASEVKDKTLFLIQEVNSIITQDFQPGVQLEEILNEITQKRREQVFISEITLYQSLVTHTVLKKEGRIYY